MDFFSKSNNPTPTGGEQKQRTRENIGKQKHLAKNARKAKKNQEKHRKHNKRNSKKKHQNTTEKRRTKKNQEDLPSREHKGCDCIISSFFMLHFRERFTNRLVHCAFRAVHRSRDPLGRSRTLSVALGTCTATFGPLLAALGPLLGCSWGALGRKTIQRALETPVLRSCFARCFRGILNFPVRFCCLLMFASFFVLMCFSCLLCSLCVLPCCLLCLFGFVC